MDLALDGPDEEARSNRLEWRHSLEAHLTACPACQEHWRRLRLADAVLRVPQPVPAPEGLLTEFRGRVEARSRPSRRPTGLRRWLVPTGALTLAGSAAALVLMLHRPPAADFANLARAQRPPASALEQMAAAPPTTEAESLPQPSPVLPPTTPPATAREDVPLRFSTPAPSGTPAGPALPGGSPGAASPIRTPEAATGQPGATTNASEVAAGEDGGKSRPQIGAGATGVYRTDGARPPRRRPAAGNDTGRVPRREPAVSPLVLAALHRHVELRGVPAPVGMLLGELSTASGTELAVEGDLPGDAVDPEVTGGPLWLVLEAVARKARLRIYPEANRLVLSAARYRPGSPVSRKVLPSGVPAPDSVHPPAAEQQGGAPAARAGGVVQVVLQPDPALWPAEAWGDLPSRGFLPPGTPGRHGVDAGTPVPGAALPAVNPGETGPASPPRPRR
jgi:hypothetical protein